MEAFKLHKQLDEVFNTIEGLKEKLRKSSTKRKKLMKRLSEIQEVIKHLEDHSRSEESKQAISNIMDENEKIKEIII